MYFSPRRAGLTLLLVSMLLSLSSCSENVDTYANRQRLAKHLGDLVLRAQANPDDPVPLQEIVKSLNATWTFSRTAACRALLELGGQARPAIPDLLRALNSGDAFVMLEAAHALGEVSKGTPDAVAALMDKLRLPHLEVSVAAAEALGNIGAPALPAIPVLEAAAKQKSGSLATAASEALVKLRAIDTRNKSASAKKHDKLYKAGVALVQPYFLLADTPPRDANSAAGKADLADGIKKLEAAAELSPDNWANRWVLGKACEAAGRPEESNAWLKRAYELNPSQVDLAREYMQSCLRTGRIREGVSAAEHALALRPDDAGLTANLALAQLLAGRTDEAYTTVCRSSEIDPQDKTTIAVRGEIEDVRAGRKPAPTHWP